MKCPSPCGINTAPSLTFIISSMSPCTKPIFLSSSRCTLSANRCMSTHDTPVEKWYRLSVHLSFVSLSLQHFESSPNNNMNHYRIPFWIITIRQFEPSQINILNHSHAIMVIITIKHFESSQYNSLCHLRATLFIIPHIIDNTNKEIWLV